LLKSPKEESKFEESGVLVRQKINDSANNTDSEMMGKIVFYATAVAMLIFFWWLLIYDHGIVATH